MKKLIVITICSLVFMSGLVAEPIEKELMWLPAKHRTLQPYLEMAIASAQEREDCMQVLYARLNEYRTDNVEPTFTILCKKDYKNTFNVIFQITELDPNYLDRATLREQSRFAAKTERRSSLDSIRNLSINNGSASANGSETTNTAAVESAGATAETEVDGNFSLELDLGDLLLELEEDPVETNIPKRSEVF